ncbi:hypothetical protein CQ017_12280 [Arthrobacter sp. MYb224]|uniref:DUF2975 domain-containing protein n=1 Tax=unclassified Arthrobacter TaxID=235627 RepID=UPI000CFDCC1A|nr:MULTISPECIES: DUF2975 domain-containing protein [unclassified Arthrobacter]PQZ97543.1 hypothetical protein CQ017_12280 [Arthrobacter sp. MYb224]PRA04226.1 hypothetical protein CQ019_07755 [Arthrobacter sp. MYb229]PRB51862.1 hypothetical protein CQ013_08825 [Arthrobacter sp. MYb216]
MNKLPVALLRAFLILIFLGGLLWQAWVVPTLAAQNAALFPEVAFLATPYTVVVIVAIACLQVSMAAIWKLLTMVERRTIFTLRAFGWVNTIIASIAVATFLALSLGVHLLGGVGAGGPGVALAIAALTACGSAFVLLMLVMKGLLRRATNLADGMAELVENP